MEDNNQEFKIIDPNINPHPYIYEVILDIVEAEKQEGEEYSGYIYYEDGRRRMALKNHFPVITTIKVTKNEILSILKGTKGIVNITGDFKDIPSIIDVMKPYQDEINNNLKIMVEGEMNKQLEEIKESKLYYTPSLEEFHIGFEYERYHTNMMENKWVWVKEVTQPSTIEWVDDIHTDIKYMENNIRVKYLNKADIESCGFKENDEDGNFLAYKDYRLAGAYHNNIPHILIQKIVGDIGFGTRTTLFSGYIMNLSELKKLLKQLNIY